MEHIGGGLGYLAWKEGSRELTWDRTILAIDANKVAVDAPITMSLDAGLGGGLVCRYDWPGRISQVGVENLRIVSEYDRSNPKDEDHRWMGITFEAVRDAWVRQVTFAHLAGSAVAIWETASRITVEDCKSLAPVSEIGGFRRYTFLTTGQQVLFQRLYAEYGYRDFAVGFCAAGPNAFVQCHAYRPFGFSGGVDSWSCGTLFDLVTVDGQAIRLANLGPIAQGAGWNAANSVLWNCSASWIECFSPPTAYNWAFGCWAQFSGNGYWQDSNNHLQPRSLYYAQLQDRLGSEAASMADLMPFEGEGSTSPSVELAARLTSQATRPATTLVQWIDQAPAHRPIVTSHVGAKVFDQAKPRSDIAIPPQGSMQVVNGWLVYDGKVMTGKRIEVRWWSGGVRPMDLAGATPHITRFVPGRTGLGLTDDLAEVAASMLANHQVAIEHNYGLWYDRRRDDHERIRRIDGDVWPPFYEQPFARSGIGTAFDGLSLYDLTRYNAWYWSRLKEFADIADQEGLVLIHHHYFQHNILEAGAHWTDCPWRPANNVNDTGFPEPPPYAGDKRIFLAEQFYDVNNPVRRPIHKAYIEQCLRNFKDNRSVLHLTSQEYTGPVHFMQFWMDQIIDWKAKTNRHPLIGLSATKDVQDAILADPIRRAAVDVIDIRYWYYWRDGTLYAPQGGRNLAPRQHARLLQPRPSSFQQVYRAVRQYRDLFPDKAVIYSPDLQDDWAWAVFMAGGSLAPIPPIAEVGFLDAAAKMRPIDLSGQGIDAALGDQQGQWILYYREVSVLPQQVTRPVEAILIHPRDGSVLARMRLEPGARLVSPINPVVIWLRANDKDKR
jgi:hypothetical protein